MKKWYYSTLSTKGQTTVPQAVREALGAKPHDKLRFAVENGHVSVEALDMDIENLIGKFKPVPGADLSNWDKVRRDAWDEVVRDRIHRMAEE